LDAAHEASAGASFGSHPTPQNMGVSEAESTREAPWPVATFGEEFRGLEYVGLRRSTTFA